MKKRGEEKSFSLLFFSWSLGGEIAKRSFTTTEPFYASRREIRWGLCRVLFQMGKSIEWPDMLALFIPVPVS